MVNTLSFTERKRVRKNFGKLKEVSKFPNLIEIQKKSYEDFLLEHANPSESCLLYTSPSPRDS